MRPDLEQYYLIDRYLANELNTDELLAFKSRMQEDSSFAKEVSEQKALNNLILEVELKGVREQMMRDLPKITDKSFFEKSWKWFGLGALVLSGITYYKIATKETTGNDTKKTAVENNIPAPTNIIQENKIEASVSNKTKVLPVTKTFENNTSTSTSVSKATTIQTDTSSGVHAVVHTIQEKPSQISEQAELPHTYVPEVKKIDCAKTPISFTVQTQATCTGEEDGKIFIEHIEGGNKPYKYSLDESVSNKTYYTNLSNGAYVIKVTDKNGCSSEKSVNIKEKNCIQQTTKFNINPTIGEVCTIPFAKNKTGNLTIYSRSGMIVYKVTNYSDDKIEWNGTDGHGALAEPGLYMYILEYTDGTKESGEVTISR